MRNSGKILFASGTAAIALLAAAPAVAQAPADDAATSDDGKAIIITGSRIRRDPADSTLPLQILTTQDLSTKGSATPSS